MTTIDDLRATLRIELRDEDEERWEDAVLDRHLQRASRELASVWPRERKTALMTTAGSRELPVTSLEGLIRILAVEYPVAQHPPDYVQFALFGGTLTLLIDRVPAGAEDVNVYWGSLHTLDGTTSTLPPPAEDAVITGAAAFAAMEWAGFAINRANASGTAAIRDYMTWGERQLARFHAMLARFGDNGRVRSSRLFAPARDAASRNVVRWEA